MEHRFLYGPQSWKKRVLRVLQKLTFFRFCAKSVLNSAKLLPNISNFTQVYKIYQIYQIFLNFYQILPNFFQVCDLQSVVAISNSCNLHVFFCKICNPKKSGLTNILLFPTLMVPPKFCIWFWMDPPSGKYSSVRSVFSFYSQSANGMHPVRSSCLYLFVNGSMADILVEILD